MSDHAVLTLDVCAELRDLNLQYLAAQNAYQAALRVAIRMCKLDPSNNYDVNFVTGIVTRHVEPAPLDGPIASRLAELAN